MTDLTAKSIQHAGKDVLHEAKNKAASPWVQRLERLGFLVRGLIYVVIGFLALQLASGTGGAATSPTSAIAMIGSQPFGKVLLAVIALGLAGYALWGFVRAFLDPLGRGSDSKGLMARGGFLFSGISYAALLIPTVQMLTGSPAGSAQSSSTGVPSSLLAGPYAKWLVIGFGLFWIVSGAGQLLTAYQAHFTRDLKKESMSAKEIKTATLVGRAGYCARGIVFALIGVITLQTVFAAGPTQTGGFDGALTALSHAPYGSFLLALVAIGLIMFGVYSGLCAKWNKIGSRRPA